MNIPDEKVLPPSLQWLGRLFIDTVASTVRWRISSEESRRLPVLDSTIETLREELTRARKHGLEHMEALFNVGLYALLLDRDFAVVKTEMATFDKWRLRFTARQMAVLVYEASDDLSQMLGKGFRASLAALKVSPEEQQTLAKITKELSRFRGKHEHLLYREIRNVHGAHRTHDALEFLQAVDGLDPMQVFHVAAEFYEHVFHPLVGFLLRATIHAGAPATILRQLFASKVFMESVQAATDGGDGE